MWSSIVAALGTLAGAALAGYVQRSGDRRARDHAHRQEVARAVAELLEAIVRHREVHWLTDASRRRRRDGAEAHGPGDHPQRGGRPWTCTTYTWARRPTAGSHPTSRQRWRPPGTGAATPTPPGEDWAVTVRVAWGAGTPPPTRGCSDSATMSDRSPIVLPADAGVFRRSGSAYGPSSGPPPTRGPERVTEDTAWPPTGRHRSSPNRSARISHSACPAHGQAKTTLPPGSALGDGFPGENLGSIRVAGERVGRIDRTRRHARERR